MLRLVALLLLLINGVYFAWSEGKLPGLGPEQQTEPQRLQQQLKPDALRLLTKRELRQIESTTALAKPTECLQAGLFSQAQGELLRPVLASALPSDSWTLTPLLEPARWIVYMGKYASAAAMAKKRADLAPLNLQFETLQNPALKPGLSLGAYETQAAANAALGAFNRRGIRSARVLLERPETPGLMLRLARTDDALRARLDVLKPALGDKVLVPCK